MGAQPSPSSEPVAPFEPRRRRLLDRDRRRPTSLGKTKAPADICIVKASHVHVTENSRPRHPLIRVIGYMENWAFLLWSHTIWRGNYQLALPVHFEKKKRKQAAHQYEEQPRMKKPTPKPARLSPRSLRCRWPRPASRSQALHRLGCRQELEEHQAQGRASASKDLNQMTYANHRPQSTCNGLAGGAQSEAYAPRKSNSKPTVSLALRALVLNNEALTLVLQMLKFFMPEGQIPWKRTSSRVKEISGQ